MTARSVATLKAYFTTGFKPTQGQFGDVMDSFVNFLDTSAQSIASDFNVGGNFTANSIVISSAMGGNQGQGTINATGIYVNGTLIAGTVNTGAVNQLAYYPTATNSVSGTNAIPNGITATTQSAGDASSKVATTGYVDANAVGGTGQAWSDVTGSRSLGTNFTNLTGRPIQIIVNLAISPSSTANFSVGGTVLTQTGNSTNSAIIRTATSMIIPSSATYQVSQFAGTITLTQWSELR